MKLVPCLLLLCTLSMTAGIPVNAQNENHHHYAHHNVIAYSANSSSANGSSASVNANVTHNEGRNLLVSMFLVPKPAPKISIKVAAPAPKPEPYAANTYGKDGAGTYLLGKHYKVIYVGAAMIAVGAYFVYGKEHKAEDLAEFYEF